MTRCPWNPGWASGRAGFQRSGLQTVFCTWQSTNLWENISTSFYFILFEIYLLVCKYVYLYLRIRAWTWHDACVERKPNLWELVLPFYYVGPEDQTQFFRFGSMHFFFLVWFLPAEPSCLLGVLGIFMKEPRVFHTPYTKGTVFPDRTGQLHILTHSNCGRMHKGCISSS